MLELLALRRGTKRMNNTRDAIPPFGAATGSAFVRVAAIAPFWRYAVGPTAAHSPAVPYYRLAAAVAFFEEAKRDLPWAGVVLYKRRGLRGIEAVREYTPNDPSSATRPKEDSK